WLPLVFAGSAVLSDIVAAQNNRWRSRVGIDLLRPLGGDLRDHLWQQRVLDLMDSLGERLERLTRRDSKRFLGDDRTGVDAFVHVVHGHAGLMFARFERLFDRSQARVFGQ